MASEEQIKSSDSVDGGDESSHESGIGVRERTDVMVCCWVYYPVTGEKAEQGEVKSAVECLSISRPRGVVLIAGGFYFGEFINE